MIACDSGSGARDGARRPGGAGAAVPAAVLAAVLSLLAAGGPAARAENVQFPTDAGVIDLTRAPYNADPADDPADDDGAVIQAALDANQGRNRIFYLPNGTYNVRSPIRWPGDQKRNILQGQSQAGTVLKLRDNCDGFNAAATADRAILFTGAGTADRFRNSVRNLTVHSGSGNPRAIGIQFNASNQGRLERVTIRSGDGQGKIGLDMSHSASIGPLLVKRLTVQGFDVGVSARISNASQTLEHVTLSGQRVAGVRNENQALHVRNLTFTGAAPAVQNVNDFATLTLVDATLTYTGASATQAAVENAAGGGGDAFLRNVFTPGYPRSLDSPSVAGPFVAEYATRPVRTLFPGQHLSLRLPAGDTPEPPEVPLSSWVSVETAIGGQAGASAGGTLSDDTAAIQRVIDATGDVNSPHYGKTTLYFPNRGYNYYSVNGVLRVRGKVRRIVGCEGMIEGIGTIRFENTEPVVWFERFDFSIAGNRPRIVHATANAVVVSSVSNVARYANAENGARVGSGDVYLEDVNVGPSLVQGQRAWVRQLDLVDRLPGQAKLTNDGGTLWLFGYKTESEGTSLLTRNGGTTELLGYHALSNGGAKTDPLLKVTDTSRFTAGAVNLYGQSPYDVYDVLVEQTVGSETRQVLLTDPGLGQSQNGGKSLPLFAARNADAAAATRAFLQGALRARRDPATGDLLVYYGLSNAGGIAATDVTVTFNQIVVFGANNATAFYSPALPGGAVPRVDAASLSPGATAYGPVVLRFPANAAYRGQTVGLILRGAVGNDGPFDLRLYFAAP